jgi:hypothetical protein
VKHKHPKGKNGQLSRDIDVAPLLDVDPELYASLPLFVPQREMSRQARRNNIARLIEGQELLIGPGARCFALPGDKIASIIM